MGPNSGFGGNQPGNFHSASLRLFSSCPRFTKDGSSPPFILNPHRALFPFLSESKKKGKKRNFPHNPLIKFALFYSKLTIFHYTKKGFFHDKCLEFILFFFIGEKFHFLAETGKFVYGKKKVILKETWMQGLEFFLFKKKSDQPPCAVSLSHSFYLCFVVPK